MAIQSRDQLKFWFQKGKYPLASQFSDWIDSYFHKNDGIGMANVDGLTDAMNDKADKYVEGEVATLQTDVDNIKGDVQINTNDISGIKEILPNKADLVNGLVPASQLPSYVDDVLEYPTYADMEAVQGETGKIFVVIADETNGGDTTQYRWSGSAYIQLPEGTNLPIKVIKTEAELLAIQTDKSFYDYIVVNNVTTTQNLDLSSRNKQKIVIKIYNCILTLGTVNTSNSPATTDNIGSLTFTGRGNALLNVTNITSSNPYQVFAKGVIVTGNMNKTYVFYGSNISGSTITNGCISLLYIQDSLALTLQDAAADAQGYGTTYINARVWLKNCRLKAYNLSYALTTFDNVRTDVSMPDATKILVAAAIMNVAKYSCGGTYLIRPGLFGYSFGNFSAEGTTTTPINILTTGLVMFSFRHLELTAIKLEQRLSGMTTGQYATQSAAVCRFVSCTSMYSGNNVLIAIRQGSVLFEDLMALTPFLDLRVGTGVNVDFVKFKDTYLQSQVTSTNSPGGTVNEVIYENVNMQGIDPTIKGTNILIIKHCTGAVTSISANATFIPKQLVVKDNAGLSAKLQVGATTRIVSKDNVSAKINYLIIGGTTVAGLRSNDITYPTGTDLTTVPSYMAISTAPDITTIPTPITDLTTTVVPNSNGGNNGDMVVNPDGTKWEVIKNQWQNDAVSDNSFINNLN